jgi:D-alanine transaminase
MARVAYVNGRYLPLKDAAVNVEDRGYQFADGVYEVITVHDGRLVDEAGHLDRLDRSLGELRIPWPVARRVLSLILREVVRRNRVRQGIVYFQVTRGVASRDFAFPKAIEPSLTVTARAKTVSPPRLAEHGVSVITVPDIRWKRPDIKSIALLPQVLGKQQAAEAGAFEAWMVDEDGCVTEGTSSNAWIVTAEGTLVTRQADRSILRGVTRQGILRLIDAEIALEERPFTVEEAYRAREAFLTSASTYVLPIVRIDDRPVANGRPGSVAGRIRDLYLAFAAANPAPRDG